MMTQYWTVLVYLSFNGSEKKKEGIKTLLSMVFLHFDFKILVINHRREQAQVCL